MKFAILLLVVGLISPNFASISLTIYEIDLLDSLFALNGFDVSVILDNEMSAIDYKVIMERSNSLSWTLGSFKPHNCEHDFHLYHRVKRPKLIVFLYLSNSSMDNVMQQMESSVIKCNLEIRPGLFHFNNKLVNIVQDKTTYSQFDKNKHVMSKTNAYIFEKHRELFFAYDYLFCNSKWQKTRILKPPLTDAAFNSVGSPVNGCHFTVGSMPTNDYHTFAREVAEPKSPRHLWTDRGGFDVLILEHACQHMGCSVDYVNPLDFEWGRIVDEKFTGMVGDIVNEEVDIIISAIGVSHERLKV